jgi:hypothetical protein
MKRTLGQRILRGTANALLAVLPLACQSAPEEPDPTWREAEIEAPSERVLWKVALGALDRMGWPLAAGLDPSAGVAATGWKSDLHPFKGQGFRTLAELQIEPVASGRWRVRARVKKQVNDSLVKPLDARYADWKWTADDPALAAILIQHIQSELGIELEFDQASDGPRADPGSRSEPPTR